MPWDFWLIFLVLAVVIPWRGRVRLRRLLAIPAVGTKEKWILYASTIAFQWFLAGVVAWRAFARGLTRADLGLTGSLSGELVLVSVVGALLICTYQWFSLRRVSRMDGPAPDFMRKLAARIFPRNTAEFVPYCALALTAGICEEFLYRGFAMAALNRAGLFPWAVVIVTAVLFGFAHTYQGPSGVVGTGLLGVVLGVARLMTSSLIPVMVWHAVVDLVAGVAGPKFFLKDPETA
jgi:uncharacterized protein